MTYPLSSVVTSRFERLVKHKSVPVMYGGIGLSNLAIDQTLKSLATTKTESTF